MTRMVTMYHPELDAVEVVTEGAFYGKGGFRDRGWVLHQEEPEPVPAAEEPEADETEEE